MPCLAAGPPGAPPPRRSLSRRGEGGEKGGKHRPAGVSAALACGGDDAATIIVAAVAGPLLPANAANAGAADVLQRQYSLPFAIAPLLLRQLLLLLQLPWGVGICGGVGYCSGYYKARSASGRASGKKYKAQIVIYCILLAVNKFSRICWKAKSC
jgi:hypothetical protein